MSRVTAGALMRDDAVCRGIMGRGKKRAREANTRAVDEGVEARAGSLDTAGELSARCVGVAVGGGELHGWTAAASALVRAGALPLLHAGTPALLLLWLRFELRHRPTFALGLCRSLLLQRVPVRAVASHSQN